MVCIKLKVIIFVFFMCLAFCFKIRFLFQASTVLNFGIEKCPFCFNRSFCEFIDEVKIKISFLEYIVGVLNEKYVFLGLFGIQPVVIKRLASKQDSFTLDLLVENIFNDTVIDSNYTFSNKNVHFYVRSLHLLNQSFTEPSYKLRLCPTLENVNLLFDPIVKEHVHSNYLFINIWSTLILNPEPLILQFFKYENGWPVPKYFGSCGRISVMENCGKTIENYLDHPWLFRVHIVEQLLLVSYKFTFHSSDFGVYFRDISYSNIALDSDMNIRIIDFEHVIVVDKNTPEQEQPDTWHIEHKSENFYCDECVIYSPMKICNHRISDHNFYAVCKEFLHSIYPKDLGLLHSLPKNPHVAFTMEKLRFYVEECIYPSKENTRIEIVKDFIVFLNELKVAGNFTIDEFRKLI